MFHQLETKSLFLRRKCLNYQVLRKLVKTNSEMTSAVVNKVLNINQVEKMVLHFETYNFIKIVDNKAIHFSFNAENLLEYIKEQWLLANVVLPDQPSFRFKCLKGQENLKSAFNDVKNLVNTVPFNLVEARSYSDEKEESLSMEPKNVVDLLSQHFKIKSGTVLKSLTFCMPTDAVEFFYKKQQERKIWWRKFSSVPGRFQTSVVSSDKSNKSLIGEIQAEFPWGLETVEVVKHLPDICADGDNFFEIKSKRKKFIPQIVTCTTMLEKVALTYLCDSYEGLNETTDRDFLRFNRKLAPFKVAFAGTGSSAEICKTLEELALLLAKKIRKLGMSVLLLPDVCSTSVERQLTRNDALGVPFTIILNERTLKDGIIAVRSRDTTLKEQSHVSLITSYMEKIINY